MSQLLPLTRFIHFAASILMAALFVFNAVVLFPATSSKKALSGSGFGAGSLFWFSHFCRAWSGF
jgi:hypothetical protein